jgi:hypothetical protein
MPIALPRGMRKMLLACLVVLLPLGMIVGAPAAVQRKPVRISAPEGMNLQTRAAVGVAGGAAANALRTGVV